MIYRIPYKIHGRRSKTKAGIAWGSDRTENCWMTFEARSHAEAQRKLQTLILPGDPRPILGRTYVKGFTLNEDVNSKLHQLGEGFAKMQIPPKGEPRGTRT